MKRTGHRPSGSQLSPGRAAGGTLFLTALLTAVLVLSSGCVSAPPPEEGVLSLPSGLAELQWRQIAAGVEYASHPPTRYVPHLHMLRIELHNPAVRVGPQPPQPRGAEAHRIAAQTGAVAVISATPFRYDFSLCTGFRMEPVGLYKVDGVLYSQQEKEWGVLWQDFGGRLHITDGLEQTDRSRWAAGGYEPILLNGQNIGVHAARDARTAVGLDREAGRLFILVVEGGEFARRGLTSREAAEVMGRLGAFSALNFDGGDSAFLLIDSGKGRPEYLYRGGRESMACFFTVQRD